MESKGIAIVALTKNGSQLGRQLSQYLEESRLYVPERFAVWDEVFGYTTSIKCVIADCFAQYHALALIMASGIAVRSIAPFIKSKHTDPAIVVMDEGGQFVVSLLSGHCGGANELARRIAGHIGAQPVITTASDVQGTLSVDLLGQEFGWQLEMKQNIPRVSAAMVNGEKVGMVQECGERNWWPVGEALPPNLQLFPSLAAMKLSDCSAGLLISARLLDGEIDDWRGRIVIYRPKCLVIGIGLHRGSSSEAVESAILAAIKEGGFDKKCIHSLATVNARKDEAGLLSFSNRYDLPLNAFTKEQLNGVRVPNPSEIVHRYLGVWGVSEAAALVGSQADQLVLTKQKYGNITIAIGVKNDQRR